VTRRRISSTAIGLSAGRGTNSGSDFTFIHILAIALEKNAYTIGIDIAIIRILAHASEITTSAPVI
jgi:hypothetical protein